MNIAWMHISAYVGAIDFKSKSEKHMDEGRDFAVFSFGIVEYYIYSSGAE